MKNYIQILIDLDLEEGREHVRREHEGSITPMPTDEVLLVSMHKARYELKQIPANLRNESRMWLQQRGYSRHRGLPWD